MNPNFPIYVVSKGRWESRLTNRALEAMGVPHKIVIEESEVPQYSGVISRDKILVLDKKFQRDYDTCDDLGDAKSKGPGPARNFAWEHSISIGATWHWVMDDNIRCFYRLINNHKIRAGDGTIFLCMEVFVERYENVSMAGPDYDFFAPRKVKVPPLVLNTRIYSCNLIRNDLPYRWRGRYNEDTDLSLRMLKDGWCTVQFYAFLQKKIATQMMKGGCNEIFYSIEGTLPKSRMQIAMHPDVSRMVYKFRRWHHHVDYRPFKGNKLKLKLGIDLAKLKPNEYGMTLRRIKSIKKQNARQSHEEQEDSQGG